MQVYGDIVKVMENSIKFNPKLLEPIGIFHSSKVSGIYLPSMTKDPNETSYKFPHDLLFTAIHYKVWPFVVKFTLTLKHKIGAMKSVSSILADAGVNILIAEANRVGHQYAFWNAICEFEDIKAKYFDILNEIHNRKKTNENIEEIRSELRFKLKEIKSEVIKESNNIISKLEGLSPSILHSHTDIRPTKYQYLDSLSHYYSHQIYIPAFNGICDNIGIIKFDDIKAESRLGKYKSISFPTLGFATCDLDDLTLRVCIIEKEQLNKFVKFKIEYKRSCTTDDFTSTQGFLAAVSEVISNNKINMWRIYNVTKETTLHSEFGFIHAIAELNEKLDEKRIESFEERFKYQIQEKMKKMRYGKFATLSKVNIYPLRGETIFVSIKLKAPRRNDIIRMIKEVGYSEGLTDENIKIVEEYSQPLTNEVIKQINNCDAMICMFTADNDHNDFRWIEAEYMIARALNKKVVRVIDKNLKIQPIADRDTPVICFQSTQDYHEIRIKIEEAFREVLY